MIARLLSLQDPSAARAHYRDGYWQAYTMYQRLCHWADIQPSAVALHDAAGSFTFAALRDWVDTIADVLDKAGLRPGDRVANWSPSRMESAATLLACSRMGYVCVPSLHRDHTPDGVLELLERCRAAALVVERGFGAGGPDRDVAVEAAGLDAMRHVISLDPLSGDKGAAQPRYGGLQPSPDNAPPACGDPDRIGYLAFTSGTTGMPKGVMHSDNTLLANGRALTADFGFDTQSVIYTFSPMSHNMGTVSLVAMLACGGSLVLHGPIDAGRSVERVVETGATYLVGVPTHAIDLIEGLAPGTPLGAVRLFQLAGSPVPPRLAEDLMARGIRVQNCYGMTENCSFLYTRAEDSADVVVRTCGRCCEGMELAIFDPENRDRPVKDGEEGELAVRGASMMLGYFDDQLMTETSYNRDGWFMTGDLGRIDPDGNAQVLGRKKDLIIRGGRNIQPSHVEALASRHPAVSKAAAFPVPDERLGERMCLAFSLAGGHAKPAPDDILGHLDSLGLSRYDMPEYILCLDAFPMTASGKILKRELTRLAADGELNLVAVRWRPKGQG